MNEFFENLILFKKRKYGQLNRLLCILVDSGCPDMERNTHFANVKEKRSGKLERRLSMLSVFQED